MSDNIDLNRIRNGLAGSATLNGVSREVRAVSAMSIKALRSAEPATYLDVAMAVARKCMPSITDEEAGDLSVPELEAIIAVATQDLEAVRQLDPSYTPPDPNGSGPAMVPTSPA